MNAEARESRTDPASLAYEAIAADYDQHIRGDEWMRAALQRHYVRVFSPGQRVLDLGCGTGTDAVVLARHGISVLGIDGSPAMIRALDAKVAEAGVQHLVHGRVLELSRLQDLDERFDGAISSFAPLSTVDLGLFSHAARRLVRGRMVLHLLNRFSLWEWLGLLSRGHMSQARHLQEQRERTFTIGGVPVRHQQYFAREAYERFFSRDFHLRDAYSLGAIRPPHTVRRVRFTSQLEWLDTRLGRLPGLRNAGRFFVLDLERRA